MLNTKARPRLAAGGRAAGGSSGGGNRATRGYGNTPAPDRQCILRWHGRDIAKLVVARPLGQLVVGMPYRNRKAVEHPSLPPAALALAREAGCRWWVVRLDAEARCVGLPLADVERVGWLKPHRDGYPEWFVALSKFRPLAWQQWDWLPPEQSLDLDEPPPRRGPTAPTTPPARQLGLWGGEQ